MNIENYSREVIEAYKANARSMSPEQAKQQTTYGAALAASDDGQASIHNAAKVARHAIEAYEVKAKGGLSEDKAIEGAARDTANRFDDRARDTARDHSQERPKSRGMSL